MFVIEKLTVVLLPKSGRRYFHTNYYIFTIKLIRQDDCHAAGAWAPVVCPHFEFWLPWCILPTHWPVRKFWLVCKKLNEMGSKYQFFFFLSFFFFPHRPSFFLVNQLDNCMTIFVSRNVTQPCEFNHEVRPKNILPGWVKLVRRIFSSKRIFLPFFERKTELRFVFCKGTDLISTVKPVGSLQTLFLAH